jgi:hypothetical protein
MIQFFQTRNKKPISEKIGIKRVIERDFNQYMSLRKSYMEERGIEPSRNHEFEREHLEIAYRRRVVVVWVVEELKMKGDERKEKLGVGDEREDRN